MVVYHTKDGWWEYEMETNFAGGPAGAAYAKTTPSGAAELTPCNAPFNEEQTMPMAEYIHEAEEMAGQDISTKTVFTKGLKIIAGKIVQYMQNSIWLDLATGIAPAETGGGALPDSFLLHYDNLVNQYTAYGCHITKYTLSGNKGAEFLKEEIEFNAYDVVDEDVVADVAPFDLTTAPANFEDVGTTTITIDGNAIADLESFTLVIENIYTEGPQGGTYLHKYPYLEKRNVELEMEFFTFDEHLDDLLTEAYVDPIDIIFEPMGKANLTLTNMHIQPESTNINVMPEKGMKRWKTKFEIGGATVITTPA